MRALVPVGATGYTISSSGECRRGKTKEPARLLKPPAVLSCLMLGGHARHSATDNKHLVMLNEVTDRLTRDAPMS